MLVAVVIVLLTLLCLWFSWQRRHLRRHSSKIPGPSYLPLIGNLALFSGDNIKNFQTLLKLHADYGPIYRVWLGPRLMVYLSDARAVGEVLSNPRVHDHDPWIDKAMKMFVGDGLVAISGDVWKYHRKLIAPAFHRKILDTYIDVFAEKAIALEKSLHENADGTSVDLLDLMGLCTLNSIKETVVGGGPSSKTIEAYQEVKRGTDLLVRRMYQPWQLIDWLYRWTADGKEAVRLIKILHEFSESVIAKKQDDFRRGIRRSDILTSGDKKINSFLDLMIEASEQQTAPLSSADLRDEVSTLATAGTDTTALTMSYCMILIAIHTDVQDQIHEELDSIFGDSQRPVTQEDLSQMVVLDRSIKEALRMFPPVPYQPRILPEDIRIHNGMVLPKGCVVLVNTLALHRNEDNFKDAGSFNPDRWITQKIHPFAYIPYSAGQRTCIGRHYANLQMKCTLSTILRRLTLKTDLTVELMTGNLLAALSMYLKPGMGYNVQLSRRTPLL